MAEKLLELLYPQRCPFCDEVLKKSEKTALCCDNCRPKIPWVKGAVCMKCGKPVEAPELEYCSDCQKTQHVFDQGAAVFTYSGRIPGSIYRLKAANRRDYIAFFSSAMAGKGMKYIRRWNPQLILPVPMHPKKRAARGYNQSELLARQLGEKVGIPYEPHLLVCVKKSREQKSLGQKERRKNLRGSFQVSGQIEKLERVLIVDDVYTTGSTMDEISRTLKAAGVRQVYFLVLCTGKGKNPVGMKEKV